MVRKRPLAHRGNPFGKGNFPHLGPAPLDRMPALAPSGRRPLVHDATVVDCTSVLRILHCMPIRVCRQGIARLEPSISRSVRSDSDGFHGAQSVNPGADKVSRRAQQWPTSETAAHGGTRESAARDVAGDPFTSPVARSPSPVSSLRASVREEVKPGRPLRSAVSPGRTEKGHFFAVDRSSLFPGATSGWTDNRHPSWRFLRRPPAASAFPGSASRMASSR